MKIKTLRELRISKGILPSFVAKKLGVSCRHFTRIETGQGYLTKERIRNLSKIYNVPISEIKKLGGIECQKY